MRRVQRRHTKERGAYSPPAPWTFRDEYPGDGAPRVCRSNYYWPVLLNKHEVGVIDRMLHLYSHWGLTAVSAAVQVDSKWFIVYDFEAEWQTILSFGFWIEFVDDSRQSVARISREDALKFGHQMEHGSRQVWAVPFEHYQVHRRSN